MAQVFLKETDWQHAYSELMRTVDIDPKNWDAQLDLASLLLAGGKFPDARDRVQNVLKSQPQNARAEVVLSDVDAADGNLPKALDEAQQAIQMDAGRSASYTNLAVLQQRNNDLASAEKNLQKAISLDPKSLGPILALGGALSAAESHLRRRKKNFRRPSPYIRKILAFASSSRIFILPAARRIKLKSYCRTPKIELKDNPDAYGLLGDFYISQGEVGKATAEFASLHAQHPKDNHVSAAYAQLLIQQNRMDDATKLNDDILKSNPKDTNAQILRGPDIDPPGKRTGCREPSRICHEGFSRQRFGALLSRSRLCGHLELGSGRGRMARNRAAESTDAGPGARPCLSRLLKNDNTLLTDSSNQIIKLQPRLADGYLFHARAEINSKDLAGAEADIKKAIEVAPRNSSAYVLLGALRLGQKRPDEAAGFFIQALAVNPNAADALAGLVNIDLERKDIPKALKLVQDQIPSPPKQPVLSAAWPIANPQSGFSPRRAGPLESAGPRQEQHDRLDASLERSGFSRGSPAGD